jgi:hypothetical protein
VTTVVPSRAVRRVLAFTACCALLAGCGGGGERQDAHERRGTFDVQVVESDFPRDQSISQAATMRISVRNTGDETVPDLAVSVQGFLRRDEQPGLADPNRAVFVVDRAPKGAETAYTQTWAVGPLRAGATRELRWRVTPTVAGTHTIKYTVAAGLNGLAKARASDGRAPTGTFTVRVSDAPADATVDPDTGKVVR